MAYAPWFEAGCCSADAYADKGEMMAAVAGGR
jgi:hypothetical protein